MGQPAEAKSFTELAAELSKQIAEKVGPDRACAIIPIVVEECQKLDAEGFKPKV